MGRTLGSVQPGKMARVWWEPTKDKAKTDYAGAYWPVKIIRQKGTNKLTVRYDNGEEEDVLTELISSADLPVDFGEEETGLQPGEFCEVHNGSNTDPCAWLGRVVKQTKEGDYKVEYPFHDSGAEKIKASRIRRARVLDGGMWRLLKPHQTWRDGEVTSPFELEVIDEDELGEHVTLPDSVVPKVKKAPASASKPAPGSLGPKGSAKRKFRPEPESESEEEEEEEEESEVSEEEEEEDSDEEESPKKGSRRSLKRARKEKAKERLPAGKIPGRNLSRTEPSREEQHKVKPESASDPSSGGRSKAAGAGAAAAATAAAAPDGSPVVNTLATAAAMIAAAGIQDPLIKNQLMSLMHTTAAGAGSSASGSAEVVLILPGSTLVKQPTVQGQPPIYLILPPGADLPPLGAGMTGHKITSPTPLGIPVAGPIRPGASGGSKPSGDTGGSGGGPGGGSAGGKPAGAGASTGSKAAGAGGPSSPSGAGGSGAPSKPKNGTSLGGKGGATAAADSKTKPGPSKVGGSTSFDAKAVAKKAAEVDKKHKLPKSAFSYFFARHKAECEVLFPEANYTQVHQEMGRWWKVVPPDEKAECERLAEEDKLRYLQALVKQGMTLEEANAALASARSQKKKKEGKDAGGEDGAGPSQDKDSASPDGAGTRKHPRSAYILFTLDHKKTLGPEVPSSKILEVVTEAWKDLDEEGRKKYEALAAEEKAAFEKQGAAAKAAPGAAGKTALATLPPDIQVGLAGLLEAGVNMATLASQLATAGYSAQVMDKVKQLWSKDNPGLTAAIDAYKAHVFGQAPPDYVSFCSALLGPEELEQFKMSESDLAQAAAAAAAVSAALTGEPEAGAAAGDDGQEDLEADVEEEEGDAAAGAAGGAAHSVDSGRTDSGPGGPGEEEAGAEADAAAEVAAAIGGSEEGEGTKGGKAADPDDVADAPQPMETDVPEAAEGGEGGAGAGASEAAGDGLADSFLA